MLPWPSHSCEASNALDLTSQLFRFLRRHYVDAADSSRLHIHFLNPEWDEVLRPTAMVEKAETVSSADTASMSGGDTADAAGGASGHGEYGSTQVSGAVNVYHTCIHTSAAHQYPRRHRRPNDRQHRTTRPRPHRCVEADAVSVVGSSLMSAARQR